MATRVRQFVIHGASPKAAAVSASDWAERLAGVMAQFRPPGCAGNHLTYSPYVLPVVIDGVRGIVVDQRLRDLEPLAYKFVVDFARQPSQDRRARGLTPIGAGSGRRLQARAPGSRTTAKSAH